MTDHEKPIPRWTARRPLPTVEEIQASRDRLRALFAATDAALNAGPDLTELEPRRPRRRPE